MFEYTLSWCTKTLRLVEMLNNKFKHYYVHADNSVSVFDPSEIESNTPHVVVYFHSAGEVQCYYRELLEGQDDTDVANELESTLYKNGVVDEDEGMDVANILIENIDTIKSNVTSVVNDVNNFISDSIDDSDWLTETEYDDIDLSEVEVDMEDVELDEEDGMYELEE